LHFVVNVAYNRRNQQRYGNDRVYSNLFKWYLSFLVTLAAFVVTTHSLPVTSACAAERVYTLVTGDSRIAISGTLTTTFGTASIQPQGAGAANASYSGTIRTDRDDGSIQFLSGSDIDANVTGNWQPLANGDAGSAPADYGLRVSYLFGLVSANIAGRDLAAGLTSGVLPVNNQGDFSLATTTVTFLDGNIAYRATTGQVGSDSVIGEDGTLSGTASLSTSPSGGTLLETLTIPVNVTIPIAVDASTSVNLILTGQLIATAELPATIPGDFNEDGTVDGADYVVWRKGVDVAPTSANYEQWRTNFGQTQAGVGGTEANAAVPEPNSCLLVCVAAIATFVRCRRLTRSGSA
jgi:hypothetical protein